MGHDISAYTKSGELIQGPYFSRYWCPHYEYFGAHHHNDWISGDGKSEEVTADQLRRVLRKVNQDLFNAQDTLEKHLEEHGDYWDLGYDAEVDPRVRSEQDALDMVTSTLEEFSEFLKTCIAEDVERIEFW